MAREKKLNRRSAHLSATNNRIDFFVVIRGGAEGWISFAAKASHSFFFCPSLDLVSSC